MLKLLGACAVAGVLVIAAAPAAADTVVIDYERFAHNDTVRTLDTSAKTAGFRTESNSGSIVFWGRNAPQNADEGGATFGASRGVLTIARLDSTVFDLVSVDVGDLANAGLSGNFTVFGFSDAGPSAFVQQTFTLDSVFGLQTFNLDGFVGLTRVQFAAAPSLAEHGIQIDNVVVANTAPVSPVPEPATWAFLIAGFGASGLALRSARRGALASASRA